ncbi:hypothetical protein [Sphingomonas mesophila]|uniref:hypothetical protein n=1 Tax=Sphingomonas mesophila TaxID=2303576 RepID=UPI000E57DEFE|nr:hypothetical protein [Sphingomonas mesophila]
MRHLFLLGLIALGGCQTPGAPSEPSLAPRAAEAIDPRLPVEAAVDARPADPALAARIAALVGQADQAANAFAAAEPRVRSAAEEAGPRESESWIAATLALGELERIRAPFTAALAELDALRAAAVRNPAASAADLAALAEASERLRGLDVVQAGALDSIRLAIAG